MSKILKVKIMVRSVLMLTHWVEARDAETCSVGDSPT